MKVFGILGYIASCLCVYALPIATALILPTATASYNESPCVYDLWNTLDEFQDTKDLHDLLLENDWVSKTLSLQELDYILVLTQQLNETFFQNVPVSLTLAVVSVESSFQSDLVGFSNYIGLMQVIAKWHPERIEQYLYDENVDLTDPRLNVMVGMDYLDELLEQSGGDICQALMMYNEGPSRGRKHYARSGASYYAEMVMYRMDAINSVLERRE